MAVRPYAPGDDLALAEVFPDAATPAGHALRNLFRADADQPVSRCVVATLGDADSGILVGAAAIAESPAHPHRAWAYVEVAEAERRRGVGRELLAAVREQVIGTAVAGLPLRTRVGAGSAGEAAARAVGFVPLFTTRVIEVAPSALGSLGADRLEDLEITATGSVALTQTFAAWYTGVNRQDPPAEMMLGQVNARFLSEAAGAHGAALLRGGQGDSQGDSKDARRGEVTAFAVSYAQEAAGGRDATSGGQDAAVGGPGVAGSLDGQESAGGFRGDPGAPAAGATELTLGSLHDARDRDTSSRDASTAGEDRPPADDPDEAEFQAALGDAAVLLARLSVDTPVALEVTSEMPVISALVDGLLTAGQARVAQEYVTLGLG